MQRRAGRVHGQVPEGLDARRPPALGLGPLDGQHVIGEDRPEGLGRRRGAFESLGRQLDGQVCCLDTEEDVSLKRLRANINARPGYAADRCQLTEINTTQIPVQNGI